MKAVPGIIAIVNMIFCAIAILFIVGFVAMVFGAC